MQAEIVTIGTELLLGEIVDTNSAWIAQRLTTIGLNLYYTTTVGDNLERIASVLAQALQRSDVVITTGGLGPTVDDMTREAVAMATERELALDEYLVAEIACFFARRDHRMTDNNRKQAYLPVGARIIHNPVGTAPCFAVGHRGHLIISLPGVPHEMRHLMETAVLPLLKERFALTGVIKSRTVHTSGIGESTVDSKIGDLMRSANPTVGTRAHPGQTDIVITAKADSDTMAEALIAPVEREIRDRLGVVVFGVEEENHALVVAKLLADKGMTLALVETTTLGELARELYSSPLWNNILSCGIVLAENCSGPLAVEPALVAKNGFASQVVADALAQAVRDLGGADLGLAIVGPHDLGQAGAPPVYYSLALRDQTIQGRPRRGRAGPSGLGWLRHLGLELVRRHLLGLEIV